MSKLDTYFFYKMNNILNIELTEDRDIIENIGNGQKETAARDFVRKYQKFVYATAYRYLQDFDDAEDAAQETFIKAIRYLPKFKGNSSLQTWLYRIVVNVSISMLRKRKIRNMFDIIGKNTESSEGIDIQDPNNNPQILLEGKETNEAFLQALALLPEKQRETFALRYFEDMSYEEISNILGTSVGGLKANFYHAVKKLAKYIKEEN